MGLNTPLPLPLREECRKAGNIVNSFVDVHHNGLDKVIPRWVLERAAGFAIYTVAKAGFLFSARAGSGVVIARLDDGSWSPPTGIGVGGMGFGGQAGAEVTDFLIVLNSRAALATFMSSGSLTLGGNLSVAVGPLGRNAEGSGAINTKGRMAAMYSYSKTKGLFGGVSVEGTVIAERQDANRLAYGGNPTAKQILTGSFDPPDWAYPLIDALDNATGMPGGHQWVDDRYMNDEQGYSSPTRNGNGNGYAFGESAGGAGGAAPARKRSSSLFSMGHRDRTTTPTYSGRDSPAPNGRSGSPSRPWEMRRASSYLPNLPSSNSMKFGNKTRERRATGPSSESYNAEHDSQYTRRGNAPRRPYESKATPSPFASEFDREVSPHSNTPPQSTSLSSGEDSPKEEDLMSWDQRPTLSYDSNPTPLPAQATGRARSQSTPRELLGSWDADPHGLTTNFANLRASETNGHSNGHTNGHGGRPSGGSISRSRRTSNLPPFDERVERNGYHSQNDWDRYGNGGGKPRRSNERDRSRDRDLGYSNDKYAQRNRDRSIGDDYRDSYAPPAPKSFQGGGGGLRGIDDNDGHARAIAIFEFKGGQDGDLAFKKGQVLTVLNSVGDGEWWRGRAVGGGDARGEGIFPANYVEVLDIPRDLKNGMSRSLLKTRVLGLNDFD